MFRQPYRERYAAESDAGLDARSVCWNNSWRWNITTAFNSSLIERRALWSPESQPTDVDFCDNFDLRVI